MFKLACAPSRNAGLFVMALVAGVVGVARAEAPPEVGFTVVIDPGHGGSNLGTPGRGVHEKRVTLAVARAVARELERTGVRVVLTRERDEYVTLGERVRRANGSGGQAFVSIHANASTDHRRRGVETFVGAPEFADVMAARAGIDADAARAMTARAEARRVARDSVRLAEVLQRRLAAARPGDRGLRQASYDVLDGVTVPAALVEIGFIDHAIEGEELLKPEVLATIASALAEGIREFLTRGAAHQLAAAPRL